MPKAVLKQIENVKTGVGIDIVGTMPLLDPEATVDLTTLNGES